MCDSFQPHGLYSTRLLCPWDFPGKNTGMGCHFLLQGIFLTQGKNLHLLCLLHWQADCLPLAPPGKRHLAGALLPFWVGSFFIMGEEMATHSSFPAWRIPWAEEPGWLQSTGLQSWTRLSDWAWAQGFNSRKCGYKGNILVAFTYSIWGCEGDKIFFNIRFLGKYWMEFKVESQEIPGVTGKFGLGVQNKAGQ